MGKERPGRTATCADCGAVLPVGRRGPLPVRCKPCRRAAQNARAAEARRNREEDCAWLQGLEDDLRALADELIPVWLALRRTDTEASARVEAADRAIRAQATRCLKRRAELELRAQRMRQRAYVLERKARARRRQERDAAVLRSGTQRERAWWERPPAAETDT